jgi:uncharacterized protein
MPDAVVAQAARRIAEHVRAHEVPRVDVVLHGGEPLLAGLGKLERVVTRMRGAVGSAARVQVTVQTNAVRLDRPYLDLFGRLGVSVSVSIDGDQAAHDRHRRFRGGRGSYPIVAAAVRQLSTEQPSLFNGLLCTIDLRNDPVGTYESLLAFQPPAVDFLLPHGNWTAPPPGRAADAAATPYADWLIAVFDRWYTALRRETTVRLFEEIIQVLLGGASRLHGVGLSPFAVAVVETDGAIEASDTLASAYQGAAATGLHVDTHRFDALLRLPQMRAEQSGVAGLPPACRSCAVHRVCGGGLPAHRYRSGSGFDNPSVYCADLYRLIGHIRNAVAGDVAAIRFGAR